MRIFLTGGTGLLGSHFADLATAEGADLVALVRPGSNTTHLESLGARLSAGDLRDLSSLISGMRGSDAVVHAASPIGNWRPPGLYEQVTVGGTRNILAAMRACSVRTLVHVSTISVHGLDPIRGKPVSEADGFGRHFLPYNHYGLAKVEAERLVWRVAQAGLVRATVLRPGWIYGPRDDNNYGRVADVMRRVGAFKIGRGDNRIPLVYAGNVARAIWLALNHGSSGYRVYLCACDGQVTQNETIASLARAAGLAGRPIPLPKGPLLALAALQERLSALSGYRLPVLLSRYAVHLMGSDWRFDQSCIERELGYTPQVGYAEGLALTEAWYRVSRSIEPGRLN